MDADLARAVRDARTTLVRVIEAADGAAVVGPLRAVLAVLERLEAASGEGASGERAALGAEEWAGSGGAGSAPAGGSAAAGAPAAAGAANGDERAALERRVAELSRAVSLSDEFLSTLGHELRNPLAPIYMQAQYLLGAVRQGDPKALSREWLGTQLEGFCRRLHKFLEMLNRIMDVSRMSAGQLNLELEEVDLVEVVREVAGNFERELGAARSELRLELPPRCIGWWDRMRVEQIVTNLLSNAIRYGASRPIEVRVGGEDGRVELSVKDHGVGIADENLHRVFERFERAGKTRSSGGFGIGLWTVRQSCLAMGGHVSVTSQLGEGSEFRVLLPRATEKGDSR